MRRFTIRGLDPSQKLVSAMFEASSEHSLRSKLEQKGWKIYEIQEEDDDVVLLSQKTAYSASQNPHQNQYQPSEGVTSSLKV